MSTSTTTLMHRSSAPRENPEEAAPPRCIIVTGPRGAGKTRWLQQYVNSLLAQQPSARPAMLLAEEGRTRMEAFCQGTPGVVVRKLSLPCLCCPAVSDLPGNVRALVETAEADWLFIEMPVIAAPGLLAEFDRMLCWPRSLVVCLTPTWAKAWHTQALSPFQSCLLDEADTVIANPGEATLATDALLEQSTHQPKFLSL